MAESKVESKPENEENLGGEVNVPNDVNEVKEEQPELSEEKVTHYESVLREIITPSTVLTLSKSGARTELETRLGLPEGELKPYRKQFNSIVDKIVEQIEVPATAAAEEEPPVKETTGPKRRKTMEESKKAESSNESNNSGTATSDDSASESDNATSKKKGKPQPKRGGKISQSRLMTKSHFMDNAQNIDIQFGDTQLCCKPKIFSTGSCGWGHNGRIWLKVGNKDVNCMLSISCTTVGSRDWDMGKVQKT